jgi:hypothetical protein
MQEFFKEHVALERAKLAAYRPFRDRFFVDGYKPFSPDSMCRSCESEKVCSNESSGSEATVVTSASFRSIEVQLRYHLRSRNGSWVIAKVEAFCKVCNGTRKTTDDMECTRCEGTGWENLRT